MRKVTLGLCLLLMSSALVCAMSKSSKNVPAEKSKTDATSVSSKIKDQKRGALLLNLPKAVAQVVSPDDYVDVLVTFDAVMKDERHQNVTATLLQNVQVITVGTDDNTAYVVLALSPRDAQYLALAQKDGNISITLRAAGDEANYLMEIATFEKLFN